MTYTLANNFLKVQVKSKGAELSSIQSLDGLEYIWQADPAVWSRHAPVLFPIVGKLKNNEYSHGGQTYTLSQHGFARDHEFECIEQTADKLVFELRANEQTKKVYPFSFVLAITYSLRDNQLTVAYEVGNEGAKPMYFSLGAHPGFNCPLLPTEQLEDYYLEFEQPETLDRHLLDGGLFNRETEPVLEEEQILPLYREWFEKDAIVFKHFKSKSLTLKSKVSNHSVKATFEGFPYLGIWQSKGEKATFICIEPWYGLADYTDSTGKLEEKEGILTVSGQEQFSAFYTIELS